MFIIEFGSHAKNPTAEYDPDNGPRDIDVLCNSGGYSVKQADNSYVTRETKTDKEVEEIVRYEYPNWKGPVDIIRSETPTIPFPFDSDDRFFKILFSDDKDLEFKFESVRENISAVFREGKGVDKALERLGTENFCIGLEEKRLILYTSWRSRYRNTYSNSFCRKSSRKSALLHFGEENLEILFKKLWWGPFLRLYLSTESFKETGMEEIRKRSSMGVGICQLQIDNEHHRFLCKYPEIKDWKEENGERYAGWDLDELMGLLKKTT